MYTYTDIKLQNQQDAFSAMFLHVSRSILDLCGVRTGEGIIRESVRRAGRASGQAQLARFHHAGVKANLHSLYHVGRDYVDDPRVRGQEIFDEEDRQIWEVYTCPLADFWNKHGESKLGSFFCEEYQYARLLAFTEGAGQLNLSKVLTCPRDNFCRFSAYFRESNTSPERAKASFSHGDSAPSQAEAAPEDVSFDQGIRSLTISVYCQLLAVARERCGQEGVCAVAEGLKAWARQAAESLRLQASHTLKPLDASFVEENFPLRTDPASDPAWQLWDDPSAQKLMETLVLNPIAALEV